MQQYFKINFIDVPSRGIEPLFEAPQASVLSVERRGHITLVQNLKCKDKNLGNSPMANNKNFDILYLI